MPARLTLPQNYIITPGTCIENFSNFSDWAVLDPAKGTISADTEHYRAPGTQSLKLEANAGQLLTAQKYVPFNLQESGSVFRLWVYIPDPTNINYIYLDFSSNGTWWHSWFGFDCSSSRSVPGWNCFTIHKDSMDRTYDPPNIFSWANVTRIRVQLSARSGGPTSASFGEITLGEESLPRIMVQFDDASPTEYSEGFTYLYNQKGKMGTIWVISDWINTASGMTKVQLDEVYAAGWALGNHTKTHQYLRTLSKSAQREEISGGLQWLLDNGYTRAAYHLAYPSGGFNSDTYENMSDLGILTGRGVVPWPQVTPASEMYCLTGSLATSSNPTISVSTAKGWIDRAISTGSTLSLVFHSLRESQLIYNTDYLVADFKAIIDYAIARGMKFVTIDEWYEGLAYLRYRSLPVNRGYRYR